MFIRSCSCKATRFIFFRALAESLHFYDHVAIGMFFLSALVCFLMSTLFHTHFSHSKEAFIKFGCLDYAGISTLICGSCCIVTYFSFYCESVPRTICLVVTVAIASVGILGPLFEKWSHRSFRFWRVMIYLSSGIVSAAPVLYYLSRDGFPPLHVGGYWAWFWVSLIIENLM